MTTAKNPMVLGNGNGKPPKDPMKGSRILFNVIRTATINQAYGKERNHEKMNNFANSMRNEGNITTTENGAVALSSTGNAVLNLFSVIGALRNTGWRETTIDENRAERLFAEAYMEDDLLTAKTLFYGRDIREGLGEREIFRILMKYAAKYHPECLRPNLDLIGVYGRYDDLYSLIGTQLEDDMWKAMSAQFEEDKANLAEGNAISLLAKWIKTPDASSKKTRALGILTARKLGYSVYDFKRILRAMRKHLDIVERHMSANEWDKITYSAVPSRAMMIYRGAFYRHDAERFDTFIQKAINGEEKINSGTLYPYDIVEKYLYGDGGNNLDVLEAQWRQLPNYIEPNQNIMIMADVSGSMYGRPMASSIGLAMYFAERNVGDFHNLFMTFSSTPSIVQIKGETLKQKIDFIKRADWGNNTNLEAAFNLVLDIGTKNHIPQSEMPKAIIVVTDMEIDDTWMRHEPSSSWMFYDEMKARFADAGYTIPKVVFWNVESRNDVFHADANREGVQLVSGHSTNTFKVLLKCLDMTPYEMMLEVLNSERYAGITVD